MVIPKHADKYEMRSSIIFFDDQGILYSNAKPDAPKVSTDREILADLAKLKELCGGRKVCMIIQSNLVALFPGKKQRDLIATELNTMVKAMAFITTSPLNKMVINLFFTLKPPKYPAKMFTDEKLAIDWIREHELCALK